jgi:hypothetical protein
VTVEPRPVGMMQNTTIKYALYDPSDMEGRVYFCWHCCPRTKAATSHVCQDQCTCLLPYPPLPTHLFKPPPPPPPCAQGTAPIAVPRARIRNTPLFVRAMTMPMNVRGLGESVLSRALILSMLPGKNTAVHGIMPVSLPSRMPAPVIHDALRHAPFQ